MQNLIGQIMMKSLQGLVKTGKCEIVKQERWKFLEHFGTFLENAIFLIQNFIFRFHDAYTHTRGEFYLVRRLAGRFQIFEENMIEIAEVYNLSKMWKK